MGTVCVCTGGASMAECLEGREFADLQDEVERRGSCCGI